MDKITQFASILGYSVVERDNPKSLEEAGAYIRDLSQLTVADIDAMRILYDIYKDLFTGGKVPTDPNPYTERIGDVLKAVDHSGMSRDDFYSRCSRLNGFGLAIEVQKNFGRVGLDDYSFRLTGRAVALIRMIGEDGS